MVRHLERAEAVARFRLTTGHDLLVVYLQWFCLVILTMARMDGDHLLQCTGLDEHQTGNVVFVVHVVQQPTVFIKVIKTEKKIRMVSSYLYSCSDSSNAQTIRSCW
ncbi:hypothetical protein TNCV_512451 [Trichonephila clavipes]|nr:hypothetical protein TNCV_512451 [Trichonephila clavipes]